MKYKSEIIIPMKKSISANCGESFSASSRRPGYVLIPSMGAENMPDFNDIKNTLEAAGTPVLNPDLSKRDAIQDLPWNDINVIDLSNMRGCLTSYGRYCGILDRLYDCIIDQKKGGHPIKIFPDFDAIEWIASKATYLKFLNMSHIPTIPTKSLCCLQDIEGATIISQPNNFENMLNDIKEFMQNAKTDHFVLKPSTSSLGRGLIFIDYQPENDAYMVSIPREEDQEACQVSYKGFENLQSYLMNYFTNTPSPDHHFLFQEYVPNIETSAVFIDSKPHFVERKQGEKSRIAHARYGGTDTFIANPNREMVNFVYSVMRSLPQNIQNSNFLRVDVMRNTETGEYVFSEIEGAGATRFWLHQAGRVNDYVNMVSRSNQKIAQNTAIMLHPTGSSQMTEAGIIDVA
jgi:hypothetical protein